MAAGYYIGKRLSYGGSPCTVRYIGQVQGTKGEWLGVEWDDPSRGKHSGEHGGTKYFECRRAHPSAGSFVRPSRPHDPPSTFVEALRKKYASEVGEDPDVSIAFFIDAPGSIQQHKTIRISGKEVEEVGFEKIRRKLADLHELKIVLLDGMCMFRPLARLEDGAEPASCSEIERDVLDTSPKIVELDLSRNLFEDWREIISICKQLTQLRSLRVDGNRFRSVGLSSKEHSTAISAFGGITTLTLADTLLDWHDIARITSLFPDLTSLIASSNAFQRLSGHSLPATITDLEVEYNDFRALSDLGPLTKLPNLKRLMLKNNSICDIASSAPEAGSITAPRFSESVTDIDLSWNEISTWNFIDNLQDVFPGMTRLRISHNPLYQSLSAADGRLLSAEDGYMLTLARVGQLKALNYSTITPKERLNAETYYLSLIAKELSAQPENNAASIIATHRRYAELCDEYGEPTVQRSSPTINPNSLAARLLKCRFRLGPSAQAEVNGSADREFVADIPRTFTIYSALGFVGKRFSLPPMKLKLVWETNDWDFMAKNPVAEVGEWDEDVDEHGGQEEVARERLRREVELVAGTRLVGTWIDGSEADIRVEIR